MVTYKQLRDARPEEFEQAGQQFSKWADQVDQHATDVRKRIIDPVFSGNVWDDKAADVARDYMEGLTRGMGMSFDDMEAAGKALKTFGTDLAEAQFEAKRNVERADDAGLAIDPETGLPIGAGDDAAGSALAGSATELAAFRSDGMTTALAVLAGLQLLLVLLVPPFVVRALRRRRERQA